MTKERKAAIEQWQTAKRWIEENSSRAFIKSTVQYNWRYNCWLCQYVRDRSCDYDDNYEYQGCKHCPLNKWAVAKGVIKKHNEFGCTHRHKTIYNIVCNPKYPLADRLEACDLIIRALKGEHIWED